MLVNEEQYSKAPSPIEVSLEFSPNVTLVNEEQYSKAPFPIEVTVFGITVF